MSERERVREQMAKRVYFEGEYYEEGTVADVTWRDSLRYFKEHGYGSVAKSFLIADQILAIKGIRIEEKDQRLPPYPFKYYRYTREDVDKAMQEVVEAGFVKVVSHD